MYKSTNNKHANTYTRRALLQLEKNASNIPLCVIDEVCYLNISQIKSICLLHKKPNNKRNIYLNNYIKF